MFSVRYRQIGAKINYYRRLKGYSQEYFANCVGITPSYLSRIEHGCTMPSMQVFLMIEKELGVDLGIIVTAKNI